MVRRAGEEETRAVVGTWVEVVVVVGRTSWISGALLRVPLLPPTQLSRVGLLGGRGVVEYPSLLQLLIFSPLLGSLSLHCGTC